MTTKTYDDLLVELNQSARVGNHKTAIGAITALLEKLVADVNGAPAPADLSQFGLIPEIAALVETPTPSAETPAPVVTETPAPAVAAPAPKAVAKKPAAKAKPKA